MLASRIGSFEGLRIADLFAGSGALGFEALSRGAASATFVEKDQAAIAIIRANAAKLGAVDRTHVIGGSALSLPKSESFDLILADPPYAAGSGTQALKSVVDAGWTATGCWIAIETERGDPVEPPRDGVICEAERDVGRARLTLLRCS
jgi:16S rRNA (guanine966-N2)-methyltransferase